MPVQVDQIMHRTRQIRAQILTEIQAATPAATMQRPGERWSARDVLIHLGNWEAEAVAWFKLLLKNEPIQQSPLPIDQWNAEAMAPYAHLDLAGALAYIAGTRQELEAVTAQITNQHLASNPAFLGLLLMTPDHEIGHLHQIREALAHAQGAPQAAARHYLAYARQRVLTRLNLEYRSPASLDWRPSAGVPSIKEILLGLALRDRQGAQALRAFALGNPLTEVTEPEETPTPSYLTLGEALHELGAARGALAAELDHLTAEQIAAPELQVWLKAARKHDDDQMHQILDRIAGWRRAQ